MNTPLSAPLSMKRKSRRSSKSLYSLSERNQPLPRSRKMTPSFTENLPLFMMCQPSRLLPSKSIVNPGSLADLSSATRSAGGAANATGAQAGAGGGANNLGGPPIYGAAHPARPQPAPAGSACQPAQQRMAAAPSNLCIDGSP